MSGQQELKDPVRLPIPTESLLSGHLIIFRLHPQCLSPLCEGGKFSSGSGPEPKKVLLIQDRGYQQSG